MHTPEEKLDEIIEAMDFECQLTRLDQDSEERALGGSIFRALFGIALSTIVKDEELEYIEDLVGEVCNEYIYEADSFSAKEVRNFLKPYLK